ncbi:trypsin-like peptidase domain-containing protein [Streptomyces sp. WMMC500]|uniref:S1C family serine protease n=1 Tax=Streptomyces sp. WMMC500 TaxID=3015154 RepID=UPI00248BB073|nr:trypsin-like peptidase domain-containing protein [Streptomyces sp. WMMC500]WBB58436.1 trypsin-like peptidase domain-containing protein [Streptomyces sp. WMMC500]
MTEHTYSTSIQAADGAAAGHPQTLAGGQGAHGGFAGFGAPPPPPAGPPRRRRAKGPLGLLAAAALVAAIVGGGSAALVGELTDSSGTSSSSSAAGAASGTQVSAGSNGTVAGVAAAVSPSVVEIQASSSAGQSTGSGVVVSESGEILTNNHVVSGAQQVQVTFSDGSTASAEVVGTDPDLDMALVKVSGKSGLKPAVLGDSDSLKVGDQVVAIGSPEGLSGTVTSGIVSALDRDVTVEKEPEQQQPRGGGQWPFGFGGGQYNGELGSETTTYQAIQTDASLNHGNSGGALVDMQGRIVGINSAMYTPPEDSSSGSVGLGFAIPINDVKHILDDLRNN